MRTRVRSGLVGVLVAGTAVSALTSCQTVALSGGAGASPMPDAGTAIASPGALERPGPLIVASGLPFAEPPADVYDPILHSSSALDPTFQEQVDFWVDFWTSRQADYFGRYLERMGAYGTFVEEELAERGLPASLLYLPIVESGYHPEVVSRAGATGMWQIMPPTARGLGLTVSSIVDDRRDPVASTHAALDYLEELHGIFGSWFLALAAYNAGPGRVGGLLDRYGWGEAPGGDASFLEIRPYLPAETREFVPRFFAAARLAMNPESFGLPSVVPTPLAYDEVVVPEATSLDVIAGAAGVSEQEILSLNGHFLRGFTPQGEARTVRVPVGRADAFERAYALIPPHERLTFLEHVVAPGETFTHIARQYGVPVADLTGTNANLDPRRLQIGMRVIVPVGTSGRTGGTELAQAATPTVHVVTSGESLWTIARRYGVTPEALAGANGRSSSALLRIGEELRIP